MHLCAKFKNVYSSKVQGTQYGAMNYGSAPIITQLAPTPSTGQNNKKHNEL